MPAAQVVGELTFGDAEAVLTMRGAEIAKWEATFNVWQKGDPPSLPIV